ncbi:MAG: T9SS type A sorting domain-containing protein [Bacteroidota bacterium]
MRYKQLKPLAIAILIILPFALFAQHYEMVKVDGNRVLLVWEESFPLDDSAPVIMPEDGLVPFVRVNLTIWQPSMRNDSAFWNNLGKQVFGRDCKIEPVAYTRISDMVTVNPKPSVSVGDAATAESQTEKPKTAQVTETYLSFSPNPATTYTIVEYMLPAKAVNASLSICTLNGNILWQQDIKKAKDQLVVDLSGFASGNYTVSLLSGKQPIATKTITISK